MRHKIILLMLPLIVMLASCNKDELGNTSHSRGRVEAEFSSQVLTKAAGNSWGVGDSIGIFMVKAGEELLEGNVIDSVINFQYKTMVGGVSGKFMPADSASKIFFPEMGDVDFVSYYPYKRAVDKFAYPVDVSYQNNQESIDLLYSNNAKGKNSSASSVAFVFKHKLTKIVIKISGKAYTEEQLAATVVSINGLNTSALVSLKDGVILQQPSAKDIVAKSIIAGKSYEAIVIPTESLNAKIEFAIAGKTLAWDIPASAFVESNRYVYDLVLGENSVVASGSDIGDWDEEDPTILKNISSMQLDSMLVEFFYDKTSRKANLITFKQIDPYTGAAFPNGYSTKVDVIHANTEVVMKGVMPMPGELSYDDKQEALLMHFTAKFTLDAAGSATICDITENDNNGIELQKYKMLYKYNENNQLISVVRKDATGATTHSENTPTWEGDNMVSCKMGYYLQTSDGQGEWQEQTETYSYSSVLNKGSLLIPAITTTAYYANNEIGIFASAIGLLGKGSKHLLSGTIDVDDYESVITYTMESDYPIGAAVTYPEEPERNLTVKYSFSL